MENWPSGCTVLIIMPAKLKNVDSVMCYSLPDEYREIWVKVWVTESLTLALASRSLHSSERNRLPKSHSLKHPFLHGHSNCAYGPGSVFMVL